MSIIILVSVSVTLGYIITLGTHDVLDCFFLPLHGLVRMERQNLSYTPEVVTPVAMDSQLLVYVILLAVGVGVALMFMVGITQLCTTCSDFLHSRMLTSLFGAKIKHFSLYAAGNSLLYFFS